MTKFEATEKETGRTVQCQATERKGLIRVRVTYSDGTVRSYPDYAFANLYVGKAR